MALDQQKITVGCATVSIRGSYEKVEGSTEYFAFNLEVTVNSDLMAEAKRILETAEAEAQRTIEIAVAEAHRTFETAEAAAREAKRLAKNLGTGNQNFR